MGVQNQHEIVIEWRLKDSDALVREAAVPEILELARALGRLAARRELASASGLISAQNAGKME